MSRRHDPGPLACQPGWRRRGRASDYSVAYQCCCEQEKWKEGIDWNLTNGGALATSDSSSHILSIDASSGGLQYVSPSGASGVASQSVNDGNWHSVTLTQYYGHGTIALYVDGSLVTQVFARSAVDSIVLSPTSSVDFRDLLIYRSGSNAEEISFNLDNRTHVLHPSLEVYAPLDATQPSENRAQSLAEVVVSGARVVTV